MGFGGAGVSKYLGVAVKLITLDMSARAIQAIPDTAFGAGGSGTTAVNTAKMVKSLATFGITLARFPVLKRMTKGMPMGLGTLVSGLMSISAIQIMISEIPNLISMFGTTTSGGTTSGGGTTTGTGAGAGTTSGGTTSATDKSLTHVGSGGGGGQLYQNAAGAKMNLTAVEAEQLFAAGYRFVGGPWASR